MINQNRSFTFKEKHLRRIKKHKKTAFRDSIITLFACVLIIGLYQTLSKMESEVVNASQYSDVNDESVLSISMVGDMMLGRWVNDVVERKGSQYPFEHAEPLFEQTDLVTGNFQHPVLIDDYRHYEEDRIDKQVTLHADTEAAEAVKEAGFTSVNLANNNMVDYGISGVFDTIETFQSLDLPTVGAGLNIDEARKIHYEQVNGMTVATLGFNDAYISEELRATSYKEGVVPLEPQYFIPDIKAAAENADFVMVHAHWGEGYDNNIHPRQRDMAYAMVEAGADLIIGHNAHVLQPVEVYDDAVILYGLGNFIFDQGWSMTRETAVFQYRLFDDHIKLEVHPMYIDETQPRPVTNKYRQEKIFNKVSENFIYSSSFNEEWNKEEGKLVKKIER
ncbi:CapA family protein [Alteribacter populi]|uniref:CapA family protein n=1 Tax=Alteribacter populi TaxID=2011011 RepID=UPI000BBA52AD|nr:CapA family protein [Alteribacter populi]